MVLCFSRSVFLGRGDRVACKAFESAKAKYTPPKVEGATDFVGYDKRIISDFKAYYPSVSTLESLPQLLRFISLNKEAMEWYKWWQTQDSIETTAPEWLPSDPESLKRWKDLQASMAALKTKERGWNERVARISDELKSVVATVGEERKAAILSLDPLLKINRVTVNELPFDEQITLAIIADDGKRREEGKKAVAAYQKKLYTALKGGAFVDPFE